MIYIEREIDRWIDRWREREREREREVSIHAQTIIPHYTVHRLASDRGART